MTYFQDLMSGNHCYGCGPGNEHGLQIKSAWDSDGKHALCYFNAQPYHCAGASSFLNGGITATIMDCHAVCTAIAHGYRAEQRDIGEGEAIWFVTGRMDIKYLKPIPCDAGILIRAEVEEEGEKSYQVRAELEVAGRICASASVEAVRVSASWME